MKLYIVKQWSPAKDYYENYIRLGLIEMKDTSYIRTRSTFLSNKIGMADYGTIKAVS